MSTLTATQLQQQYIAYFGRPGDPAGIKYWLSSSSGITTAREFADKIYAQDEYKKSTVGTKSTEEQVDSLYKNLFGRSADASGLLYWTNQIETGVLSLSNIAYDLIAAASNPVAGNETQGAADAAALSNKVTAAELYTAAVEASTTAILAYQPESTDPWVTGSAFQAGVTFLEGATATASITSASATSSVATMASTTGIATGQSFTLTSNTDNIVGGAGDDTISSSSSTFNSDDTVTGGAGSDTFTVSASVATGVTTSVIGNFTSVETVKTTNGGAADGIYSINLIGSTGVTEVSNRLSTGDVIFNNLQALATVSAFGAQSGSFTRAGFLNSLASGTADSINLKVDGGANTVFQVSGTTDTNEFETVNLESAGATKNTVTGVQDVGGNANATKTFNITGSGDIDVTLAGGATTATYDGSTATGKQGVTWAGNYTTIKTGSANDTITTAANFLGSNAPKTVDGSTGTDTLILVESVSNLTSSTTGTDHSISGIETIQLSSDIAAAATADVDFSYAADKIAGITTLTLEGTNNDSGETEADGEDLNFTVTGLTTENVEIATHFGTGTIDALSDNTINLKLKDDTGAADVINITSKNVTDKTNQFELTVDRLTSGVNNLVETVNFTASAGTSSTTTADGTVVEAFTADYSDTVNILGASDLTITTFEGRNNFATFDASAFTGNLTLGAATAGYKTTAGDNYAIKLGSGTNNVHFVAEALTKDSVIGSTGTDTVWIREGAADLKMTITDVDKVVIDGEGAAQVVSLENFTNVGEINIQDFAGADDGTADNVSITNIGAAQKVTINSDSATQGDWNGDTITLDYNPTAITTAAPGAIQSASLELKGVAPLGGGGTAPILITDSKTLSITDSIQSTTGNYTTGAIDVRGTADQDLTSLTLSGGGTASSTTQTLTVTAGANAALTALDASGFNSHLVISGMGSQTATGAAITLGATDTNITMAIADLARDETTVDGGAGSDKVIATGFATGTYRPGLSNVETVDFEFDNIVTGALTIDGSDAASVTTYHLGVDHATSATDEDITIQNFSGLDTIKTQGVYGSGAGDDVSIDDTAATTVITDDTTDFAQSGLDFADATSLTIKLASSATEATTAEFTADILSANKATTVSIGSSDTDSGGNPYVGKYDLPKVTFNVATSLTIDASEGSIDLHEVTAPKLETVTITGDNIVLFGDTAGSTAKLATFDASAATGAITVGEAVDFLNNTGVIKTGTADDTVTISVTTESNVAVDMGEKTSDSDTFGISGTANIGTTLIDLNQTDQVQNVNGIASTTVQTGIEAIDLSGITTTSNFGSNLIGFTAASNTITGGGKADNITVGTAVDYIRAREGADTIDISETTQTQDVIYMEAAASNGVDVITGFTGSDLMVLVANNTADAGTAATDYQEANPAIATLLATVGVYVDTTTNLTTPTASNVSSVVIASMTGAVATTDQFIYVASDGTDTHVFHINCLDNNNDTDDARVDTEDTITHIATLKDIAAPATTFSAANFAHTGTIGGTGTAFIQQA